MKKKTTGKRRSMNPLIHELRVGRISKNITISENMSMCSSVDSTNAAYEVQRSR